MKSEKQYKIKFEIITNKLNENNKIVDTVKNYYFQISPDDKKAFKDIRTGEVFITPENKGATISLVEEELEFYEEVEIN